VGVLKFILREIGNVWVRREGAANYARGGRAPGHFEKPILIISCFTS
jgi:hypothetical protein